MKIARDLLVSYSLLNHTRRAHLRVFLIITRMMRNTRRRMSLWAGGRAVDMSAISTSLWSQSKGLWLMKELQEIMGNNSLSISRMDSRGWKRLVCRWHKDRILIKALRNLGLQGRFLRHKESRQQWRRQLLMYPSVNKTVIRRVRPRERPSLPLCKSQTMQQTKPRDVWWRRSTRDRSRFWIRWRWSTWSSSSS